MTQIPNIKVFAVMLAAAASFGAANAFTVDAEIPAGNILVNSVNGDVVKIPFANGRRTPILFTSSAAKRNPSLIAHGELLGDVALRLMLQRIAHPDHPPCELYLDIPSEPAKTLRRSKKGKSQ